MTDRPQTARRPDECDLRREIHIWTAAVDGGPFELYESWLCPEETARYQRYIRDRDRNLFLVAHALLRHTLSLYRDVDPADWRFEAGEHGRPELMGPSGSRDLRFNISHTPGLAAVLISDGIDAGVDIERRNDTTDRAQVARRVFSKTELGELETLAPEQFEQRFYKLWTLKEAYLKARGLGLRLPLSNFAFTFGQARSIEIKFEEPIRDDGSQWQFALWQPGPSHQGAVAVRRGTQKDRPLVFRNGLQL